MMCKCKGLRFRHIGQRAPALHLWTWDDLNRASSSAFRIIVELAQLLRAAAGFGEPRRPLDGDVS